MGVCDYPDKVDCRGASTPPPPTTSQPTYPTETIPPSEIPSNPWDPPTQPQQPPYQPPPQNLHTEPSRFQPDPWHQRPVATQLQLDAENNEQVKLKFMMSIQL